jgi:hypothetical protein
MLILSEDTSNYEAIEGETQLTEAVNTFIKAMNESSVPLTIEDIKELVEVAALSAEPTDEMLGEGWEEIKAKVKGSKIGKAVRDKYHTFHANKIAKSKKFTDKEKMDRLKQLKAKAEEHGLEKTSAKVDEHINSIRQNNPVKYPKSKN